MAVSIWFLYIGIFLCASGIGLVVGAIFIAYWGIKTLEESKRGNSYTENNFTANIAHIMQVMTTQPSIQKCLEITSQRTPWRKIGE